MKKLYFVAGLPTDAEIEEATREGALIRNCLAWHEGDSFEDCDEVLGKEADIPASYRHLWKAGHEEPLPSLKKGRRQKA